MPPRAERRSLRSELGEGLRYVFTHPYQRTMVMMTALSNFFGQVVFSILLVADPSRHALDGWAMFTGSGLAILLLNLLFRLGVGGDEERHAEDEPVSSTVATATGRTSRRRRADQRQLLLA